MEDEGGTIVASPPEDDAPLLERRFTGEMLGGEGLCIAFPEIEGGVLPSDPDIDPRDRRESIPPFIEPGPPNPPIPPEDRGKLDKGAVDSEDMWGERGDLSSIGVMVLGGLVIGVTSGLSIPMGAKSDTPRGDRPALVVLVAGLRIDIVATKLLSA
jgi:hypothetical protein